MNKGLIVVVIGIVMMIVIFTVSTLIEEEKEYESNIEGEIEVENLINIKTSNIDNEEFLGEEFTKNELTLVNVWATWCPPCVAEMPHLESVYQKMKEENIGVVGIVFDVTETGSIDEGTLKTAREILEISNVTFPIIYPDSEIKQKLLSNVMVFPSTFFVDSKGNIVGEKYEGSMNEQEWINVINNELEKIR